MLPDADLKDGIVSLLLHLLAQPQRSCPRSLLQDNRRNSQIQPRVHLYLCLQVQRTASQNGGAGRLSVLLDQVQCHTLHLQPALQRQPGDSTIARRFGDPRPAVRFVGAVLGSKELILPAVDNEPD